MHESTRGARSPIPEGLGAIRSIVEEHGLQVSLLVRAGSKAYGLEIEDSDDDYLGVFVPRLRDLLSIAGLSSETHAGNDPDFTLHEIGKFCALGLKGNPAILETLWNPDVLLNDSWGRELIASRSKFLHRGSLAVYASYAEAQLKKMVRGGVLHARGGVYNGKFGLHLIRLLHAGLALAATGEVMVRVPADLAPPLRRIRSGEIDMNAVLGMSGPLLEELKRKCEANDLPAEPDRAAIEDLVVRARLSTSEG